MSTRTTVIVRDVLQTTVVVKSNSVSVLPTARVTKVVGSSQAGPQGPIGLTGPSGAVAGAYRHVQSSPAAVWTVVHNLGLRPGGIYVEDSAHSEMKPRIAYVDDNTMTLSFFSAGAPVAIAGEADIS